MFPAAKPLISPQVVAAPLLLAFFLHIFLYICIYRERSTETPRLLLAVGPERTMFLFGSKKHHHDHDHSHESDGEDQHGQLTRSPSMTKNDAAASATLAASDAWLAGHLHHLTDQEQKSLIEFKKFCEQQGYYKPAADENGGQPSHDDSTMLYVLPLSYL